MSLKIQIIGLFAVLSIFLIGQGSLDTYRAIERISNEEELKKLNQLSDSLVLAAGSMAVERGTTAGVLGGGGKASAKQKSTIQERRELSGQLLQTARDVLQSMDGDKPAEILTRLDQAVANVDVLRARVDKVMSAGINRTGYIPSH